MNFVCVATAIILVAILVVGSVVKAEDNADSNPILLYGDRNGITKLTLNTTDLSVIRTQVLRGMRPIFLDVHKGTDTIYYSDHNRHGVSISKIKLDGSEQEVVFPLDDVTAAEGVAVDWVAQNVYWITPRQHKITVSRLDGSSPRDVVSGLGDPRCLCVDPVNGLMYWSDWGERPVIERSFLDGTGRTVIVSQGLGYPNGLALDVADNKLYWGDAFYDKIEVCDMDGTNRRDVVSRDLGHVFGLALLGDDIYWSDWESKTIERANKHTGEGREVVHYGERRAMGLKVIGVDSSSDVSNTCGNNNGGCSHLCFYRPSPLTHVCACPEGMELRADDQGFEGVCHLPGSDNEDDQQVVVSSSTDSTDRPGTTSGQQGTTDSDAPSNQPEATADATTVAPSNRPGTTTAMVELGSSDKMTGVSSSSQPPEDTTYRSSQTTTMASDASGTRAAVASSAFPKTRTSQSSTDPISIVPSHQPEADISDVPHDAETTNVRTITPSTVTTTTEPPSCPKCDIPMTKESVLDYFCTLDNPTVMTGTVSDDSTRYMLGDDIVVLGVLKRARVFKNDKPDRRSRSGSGLKVVAMLDERCPCVSGSLGRDQKYLLMGDLVEGGRDNGNINNNMLITSYAQPASGTAMFTSMVALQVKDACAMHRWSKLQSQWALFADLKG